MSTTTATPARPTTVQQLHTATDALTTPARKTIEYRDFDQTATYFTPSLLEQLLDIVLKGPGRIGSGGGGSSAKEAKAPFFLPAYELMEEIRKTSRTNTQRLAGGPVPLIQPLTDSVKAWTAAATTAGGIEALSALKAQRAWAQAITTMTVPVEVQEIDATCTECQTATVRTLDEDGHTVKKPALVFQINDADSFIRCRACGSIWEHRQVEEVAAWHHGRSAEEHVAIVREELAAKAGTKTAEAPKLPNQKQMQEQLQAYTDEHGHLPPHGVNATPEEKRLAQWIRTHTKTPGTTAKVRARYEAIQALQQKYPSVSQAKRLAKQTHPTTPIIEGQQAA